MFDAATQELDRILARLLRNDPVLRLERESATNWIVVDAANQDAVMLRTPSLKTIDRFVQAFLTKHPEATFTSSGEPMRGSELPSQTGRTRPAGRCT
jgi:predicted choloylglycine hydrolase